MARSVATWLAPARNRRARGSRPVEAAVIHKYLSLYTQCAGCGQVFPADGGKYVMVAQPAPCCGAPGPRGIWPEPAIGLYIETACRQDPSEEATPRIRVLMIAAAAELMLERVVWTALAHRIDSGPVAMALIDRCEGTHRLKELFKDLVGESVDDVLRRERMASLVQDWQEVIRGRNSVAHGEWYKPVDDAVVMRFADALIHAGAALWNAAVRSAKPPSAP